MTLAEWTQVTECPSSKYKKLYNGAAVAILVLGVVWCVTMINVISDSETEQDDTETSSSSSSSLSMSSSFPCTMSPFILNEHLEQLKVSVMFLWNLC